MILIDVEFYVVFIVEGLVVGLVRFGGEVFECYDEIGDVDGVVVGVLGGVEIVFGVLLCGVMSVVFDVGGVCFF